MARIYKNIEKLKAAIESKEEKIKIESRRSTEKLSRIGFGHSMRCTRINVSFSKEDKLKSDLKELYIQLSKFK